MKKRFISIALAVTALFGVLAVPVSARTKFQMDYVYVDNKNEKLSNGTGRVYIPVTYTVDGVLSYVDDEEDITSFSSPQDIFIDPQDNLYIADTGNNRIVKMSAEGNTLAVWYMASESAFSEPQGVYVDSDNNIYVADSGNYRIVIMTQDGIMLDEIHKPDSELLSSMAEESFIPTKVAVGATGYIYTLVGKNFMSIDRNHEFKGYIGASKVGFSLVYTLLGLVLNDEQMDRIDKRTPPPYNNFTFDSEGKFLACSADSKNQIRILNTNGQNIYPTGYYGEIFSIDAEGKDYVHPNMIDLVSDSDGIISVLDSKSGCIYQYDREGNILTVFGGKGDNLGYFDLPVSIEADSKNNIYVVDSLRQNIQRFSTTSFCNQIHTAARLYYDGKYDESLKEWEQITTLCPDYPLARRRIGQIYYKDGKYKEAEEQFYRVGDMKGYSDAFVKHRMQTVSDHFLAVAIILIAAVSLLLAAIMYLRRVSDRIRDRLYAGGKINR